MLFLLLGCTEEKLKNNIKEDQTEETAISLDEDCGYTEGQKACDFTLTDQFLNNVNLYENEGSVVILDFSTMWCGYCQVSAPIGNDIYNQYKADGFNWITILIEDLQGEIPNIYDQQVWSGSFELDYSVVATSREEMIDYNSIDGYSITSWPTFLLLDKDLKISYVQQGWGEVLLINEIENYLY